MSRRILSALALSATLALTACESSDERAEEFYQSGMELVAAGDYERAILSFKNVFRFDGEHYEARKELAETHIKMGDESQAYSQFLRLAEQYPEEAFVRQRLATMAIRAQSWEQAERHGRIALELDPDAPINDSIRISLDYRKAAGEEDAPARAALAAQAQAMVDKDANDLLMRRILIAEAIALQKPKDALIHLDLAIAQRPEALGYYVLKLRALAALEEDVLVEEHLQAMFRQFPDNEDVHRSLIGYYLQRDDYVGAEAFLRERAGPETGEPEKFIPLIQLIERWKGRDAAKAELERLKNVNSDVSENANFFAALLAGYLFDDGEQERAIADMQAIVENSEQSNQTLRIKGTLATMLYRVGNAVGARALAEEVLEEDPSNVAALKLRAQFLIDTDNTADAIIDLRQALDESPRDLEILLLLASAHERNGNIDLQGERLAIAVDVSNSAPRESLLYANFLIEQGRLEAARTVLDDARNANPRHVEVLSQTARMALNVGATGTVRGIIADLERIPEDPTAAEVAIALRSALLVQQDRADEGLALLQEHAGPGGENSGAVFAIIQTYLRAGQIAEARNYLNSLLAKSPDEEALRLINAALYVAEGKPEESERVLREMIAKNPEQQTAIGQLYVQFRRMGRIEDARAVLNAGLADNPDSQRLRQYQAGELEAMGRVEEAIAIYEDLYQRNSGNVTVANNLASLITTFRDTEDSLERAARVARRLRGTTVPAFQDTYGWIAYRQGRYQEALDYLSSAAEGLPNHPLVQYHLGMTYAALQQNAKAQEALELAITLAGEETTLPQMAKAREVLDKIAAGK